MNGKKEPARYVKPCALFQNTHVAKWHTDTLSHASSLPREARWKIPLLKRYSSLKIYSFWQPQNPSFIFCREGGLLSLTHVLILKMNSLIWCQYLDELSYGFTVCSCRTNRGRHIVLWTFDASVWPLSCCTWQTSQLRSYYNDHRCEEGSVFSYNQLILEQKKKNWFEIHSLTPNLCRNKQPCDRKWPRVCRFSFQPNTTRDNFPD